MLSEAKHLKLFLWRGRGKWSEILRFAQNDRLEKRAITSFPFICYTALALVLFFEQNAQLRDRFPIFCSTCGSFDADQCGEINTSEPYAESLDLHGMRKQIVITSAPTDLAEQIEIAKTCRQREIQSTSNCFHIPGERQAFGRIAQIWSMRGENFYQTLQYSRPSVNKQDRHRR
jgi:hypothetical protein